MNQNFIGRQLERRCTGRWQSQDFDSSVHLLAEGTSDGLLAARRNTNPCAWIAFHL